MGISRRDMLSILENDDQDQFEERVKDIYVLNKLGGVFQDLHGELIDYLLSHPEQYNRIVKDSSDLAAIASWFPGQQFMLMDHLQSHPEVFRRIVTGPMELLELADAFPSHRESLIRPVLSDYELLETVLGKNDWDLHEINKQFPGHEDILGQPTVEKALEVKKVQVEKEKAYTKGAVTGALSGVLNKDIATHLVGFFDRKDAAKLAQVRREAAKEAKNEEDKVTNRPAKK